MQTAASFRPEPSAQGNLGRTPLVHILVYGIDRALNGTLALKAPGAPATDEMTLVLLERGRIRRVKTTGKPVYLGSILYELGAVDAQVLNETLFEVATQKVPHGAILRSRGVLSQEALAGALMEQMFRKLLLSMNAPAETEYRFYAEHDAFEGYGGTDWPLIDPLPAIWRGIRECPSEEHQELALARWRGRRVRLRPQAELGRLCLDPEASALTPRLREGVDVDWLLGQSSRSPRLAERLLYCLSVIKALEATGEMASDAPPPRRQSGLLAAMEGPSSGEFARRRASEAAPPVSSPPAASAPPIPPPPVPRHSTGAMHAVQAPNTPTTPSPRHPSSNRMPAAAVASNPPSTREPLAPATKRPEGFAPSQAPRQTSGSMRAVTAPPSSMSIPVVDRAASEGKISVSSLPPGSHRDVSLPQSAPKVPVPPKAQSFLSSSPFRAAPEVDPETLLSGDPERCFREAEVALARRDLAVAGRLARMAYEKSPKEPRYAVLDAWVSASLAEDPNEIAKHLTKIDAALRQDPGYERAWHYRGIIHKRLGNMEAAVRDFRKAAHLNPHNVDAAREVRLYELRKPSGLFDLFKKR